MTRFLLISVGAMVGANVRYGLQQWAADRWGATFPYGTLLINVSGSFALGFFVAIATERIAVSPNWRYLVAVGLLGGFTTFSSFTVEALMLVGSGRLLSALLYLGGNVGLGLIFAYVGMALARAL